MSRQASLGAASSAGDPFQTFTTASRKIVNGYAAAANNESLNNAISHVGQPENALEARLRQVEEERQERELEGPVQATKAKLTAKADAQAPEGLPSPPSNLHDLSHETSGLDDLAAKQEVKYVQYIPRRLGHDHVDLDAAIKSLYSV